MRITLKRHNIHSYLHKQGEDAMPQELDSSLKADILEKSSKYD